MKVKVKNLTKVTQVVSIGSGKSIYWQPREEKMLTEAELNAPRTQRFIKVGRLGVIASKQAEDARSVEKSKSGGKRTGGDSQ